jgi:methylated-DNA-[protein]-cysteine S-methyltransferase
MLATARTHTVVDSPVGPLTLVAERGALVGLYLSQQRHRPAPDLLGAPQSQPVAEPLSEVAEELRQYFAGARLSFDVPLNLVGTTFQRRVWTALREIPYGETVSYRQLADEIGQPTAARAVGLANGKNPVGIIVPCHRVVGADGSLTGYGGGLARKQQLLDHERATAALAVRVP